jgi:hypothetical protein
MGQPALIERLCGSAVRGGGGKGRTICVIFRYQLSRFACSSIVWLLLAIKAAASASPDNGSAIYLDDPAPG